jgi:CCR4-NOT transcription complex subunit 1
MQGWGMYAQLLIDLFKFLAPFLRNAELAKPVTLLYKGTLRVLLVLLHDFPEFLCDYHYGFCDVIPPNCIQVGEQTARIAYVCISVNVFGSVK